ncbi:MAG: hypothetical protein JW891_04280 [Candidatus Lokiarchaeota archaeon]|nr:hypothetical protein [Candidatus Lokiarchaeota archaeon]
MEKPNKCEILIKKLNEFLVTRVETDLYEIGQYFNKNRNDVLDLLCLYSEYRNIELWDNKILTIRTKNQSSENSIRNKEYDNSIQNYEFKG